MTVPSVSEREQAALRRRENAWRVYRLAKRQNDPDAIESAERQWHDADRAWQEAARRERDNRQ